MQPSSAPSAVACHLLRIQLGLQLARKLLIRSLGLGLLGGLCRIGLHVVDHNRARGIAPGCPRRLHLHIRCTIAVTRPAHTSVASALANAPSLRLAAALPLPLPLFPSSAASCRSRNLPFTTRASRALGYPLYTCHEVMCALNISYTHSRPHVHQIHENASSVHLPLHA